MSTYELPALLAICKNYADLGWAVRQQLEAAAEGDGEDQNPHALELAIDRFLEPLVTDRIDFKVAQAEALELIKEIEAYGIDPDEFEPVER